jgi:hypothetical protein
MWAAIALVGAAASVTVAATPADAATASSAARCSYPGHVYLTQPGRAYFSGYEGNQQFGVQTISYTQGTQSFRLGGNGISPGTFVDFFAVDRNTGAVVGFVPGHAAAYPTRAARSNCVVNEEGPYTFTLQPGNYRIQANYFPGNNPRLVTDVVVNIDVVAPPPPPPVDPWQPPDCPYGYAEACF